MFKYILNLLKNFIVFFSRKFWFDLHVKNLHAADFPIIYIYPVWAKTIVNSQLVNVQLEGEQLFSRRPATKPFFSTKTRKATLEYTKADHY